MADKTGGKAGGNVKVDLIAERRDLFANAYSGFGGTRDPFNVTSFSAGTRMTRTELDTLMEQDWVTRQIVEVYPEDATRRWIDLSIEGDSEGEWTRKLNERMRALGVKKKLREALGAARLHGGAVMVLGTTDGGDMQTPLDEAKIDKIESLNVMDRWQVSVVRKYDDPLKPNYGDPELYRLQPYIPGGRLQSEQVIHESRLIRFDGVHLSKLSRNRNMGWHDSVLTGINQTLKAFGVSIQSGAILMQDFVTKVLQIPDLAAILAKDDQSALLGRIQYAISNLSSLGIALIGGEEKFEKIQTPIRGLPELIEIYIEQISAAAKIPRTRLFGQQLGRLSGASESTRAYYDRVQSYQEDFVETPLRRIIRLLMLEDGGKEPEIWTIKFRPLWQEDTKTLAEARKLQAETDAIYIDKQVLFPEEVGISRFGGGEYSFETTLLDEEEREKLMEEQKETLPMPPGVPVPPEGDGDGGGEGEGE